MSVDFAEEAGSIIIDLDADAEGPVEVVHDDNVAVIITVARGKIVDIQILLNKEAAEKLAKLLKQQFVDQVA